MQYYTDKNISVSYLRAKKKKDADRVVALYGDAEDLELLVRVAIYNNVHVHKYNIGLCC